MRFLSSRRLAGRVGVIGITLAAAAGGFGYSALAGQATASRGVSAKPATGTPQLVQTGKEENVRQLAKCGGMIYAVGTFTNVKQGGKTYFRNNVFSFSATKPYAVSGLKVDVNGTVNTIAFTNRHGCGDAYLGGSFTSVHATAAKNIAEVSTSTGAVVQGFGRYANGEVDTLLGYRSHLLDGGHFTSTNGHARNYYASLDPTTGKDDGFLRLRVFGQRARRARQDLQPAAQPQREPAAGRRELHVSGRLAQAADIHAEPGRLAGQGHRVDLGRVQPALQVPGILLCARRGLVAQ